MASSSPHQLISLMYEGLLASLSAARLALENHDLAMKARHISRSIAIIHALRDCLDHSVESEFPHNARLLYGYMMEKLLYASRHLDVAAVQEVTQLVLTIKSGWDAIGPDR